MLPSVHRRSPACPICPSATSLVFFYSGDISWPMSRTTPLPSRDEGAAAAGDVPRGGVSADLGQAYISLPECLGLLEYRGDPPTAGQNLAAKERREQIASDPPDHGAGSLETVRERVRGVQKRPRSLPTRGRRSWCPTYQGDNSVTSWSYVLASRASGRLSQRLSG